MTAGQPPAGLRRRRGADENTRATNTTAIWVAIIALIGGSGIGGTVAKEFFPDTETVPPEQVAIADLNVDSYLTLQDKPLQPASEAPNVFKAFVNVKQELPPGTTAWIATRVIDEADAGGSENSASTDVWADHFSISLPCKFQSNAADCGRMFVGGDNQTGVFQVWIIVTDSAGTQALVYSLREETGLKWTTSAVSPRLRSPSRSAIRERDNSRLKLYCGDSVSGTTGLMPVGATSDVFLRAPPRVFQHVGRLTRAAAVLGSRELALLRQAFSNRRCTATTLRFSRICITPPCS